MTHALSSQNFVLKQDRKHLLGRLLDPPDAAEVDRCPCTLHWNQGLPPVADMSSCQAMRQPVAARAAFRHPATLGPSVALNPCCR